MFFEKTSRNIIGYSHVITKYSRDIVSKKFKNIIFPPKDNKKKWKLEKKF